MAKISPSILTADFTKLGAEIASVSTADYLHFDVMDGCFVPNISIGLPVLSSVRKKTDMILDVHLMINTPSEYVVRFAEAGGDIIVFHAEAESIETNHKTIAKVRKAGKMVGLSIKPATPVEAILPYLDALDIVLVMTVEPGFGGQSFIAETLPKISDLRNIINTRKLHCELEVDGGINEETARLCIQSGADVLVAGSYIFDKENRAAAIAQLRKIT